jgi:hypothetical protein
VQLDPGGIVSRSAARDLDGRSADRAGTSETRVLSRSPPVLLAAKGRASMENEKLATLAMGRLSRIVAQGLLGHHLLFDRAAILEAFAAADAPVVREDADAVSEALLTICREDVDAARAAVAALRTSARLSLIRLYFRMLDRAQEQQAFRH